VVPVLCAEFAKLNTKLDKLDHRAEFGELKEMILGLLQSNQKIVMNYNFANSP